jgi:hypothetical protein
MGNKQGGAASRGFARKASSKSSLKVGSPGSSPGEYSSSPSDGSGSLDVDFACTPRLDESNTYRIGILGERGTGKSALFFQLTQVRTFSDPR